VVNGVAPETLEQAYAAGRAAHPRLVVDREDFAAYLDARAGEWGGALAHAPDLYLACACLRRVAHAVDSFVALYLAKLPVYLGRLAKGEDFVAEVRQQLAERLLVGSEDHPPHLGEYAGRGSLEGWVRIAAQRTALNLVRGSGRSASFTEAVERRMVDTGGDLAVVKERYREPFSRAFTQAASLLGREHKSLLRLHYVEGMSTAQLAALYNTSRRTIVRRVGEACEALLTGVKEYLYATLGIRHDEVDELLGLVRSQLDTSLVRLLRETFG
jgi:RNA polymerase sigma-70 factor (ECF subfamily)